ncbi:MAG: metallophosphoesterase [Kiritimatiellae bacterium]|nr:metallophosphoesterase [Kiritimatiellia bacterium]
MTRRGFLVAGSAFSLAGCGGGARSLSALPRMKIGIVSDIHVTKRENATTFEKALQWFRNQGVDGVLITGDLGTKGTIDEIEVVAETWFRVFPNDRAPDGRRVERLFLLGNHDVDGFASKASWPKRQIPSREEAERTCLAFHRQEVWRRLFGEDYSQIVVKEVKGYRFVLNSWHSRVLKEKAELEDFWKGFSPTIDPSRPFFYCQHPHPKDTCSAGYMLGGAFWQGGWDDGTSTRLLSAHSNCIALSGHSHYPIDDERSIWQGAFTSVNCGCARGFAFTFPGRENGYAVTDMKAKTVFQMPPIDIKRIRQGMLMEVFDDRIVFHRREFVNDRVLGPDWVVPLGVVAPRPYEFEPRRRASRPPQFAEGASVDVTERLDGTNRDGEPCEQVVATFPSAKGEDVFDYEVFAEVRIADFTRTVASKRVFSPDAFLGAAEGGCEVTCVFAKSELPRDREIRFAARPFNCWGKGGVAIVSEWRRFAG